LTGADVARALAAAVAVAATGAVTLAWTASPDTRSDLRTELRTDVHRPVAVSLALFPDGPPARVTGGFGEDSCATCHFTSDDTPPAGRLDVAGFPDCYGAGEQYELVISLEAPDLVVAGFQLAVRVARDTSQAGRLDVRDDDERGRVAVLVDRDVAFAQHTADGSSPPAPGAASWRVSWTAPAGHARLLLHAAGLAGDGDRSEEGDRTYVVELDSGGKACRS
jgi:hypothetical protein